MGDDKKLLQFATIHLCESEFSQYSVTKIEDRNKLEAAQMEGHSCHVALVY